MELMTTEHASEHSDTGTQDTGTFDTVAAAVAEMDRRDQTRKAERKAAKAQPIDDDTSDPAENEDHDPRKVQKDKPEPKEKAPKKEPKPEAEDNESKQDDDEPEDDDEVTTDDDEDNDEDEPKQKRQAKPPLDDSEEVEHEGKTYRVPKVLKESFLRQSDYTRKTQELAQERQVVHQSYAQANETIQQAQTVQQTMLEFANAMVGTAPPLELAEANPGEYLRQRTVHEQRQQMVSDIAQQGHATRAEGQRLAEVQRAERLRDNEAKLYQHAPELKSEGNRQQFAAIAGQYLGQYGFDASELMAVEDHRTLLMVRRLVFLEYQASQQSKTAGDVSKKLANVPNRTLKPGAADAQGEKRQGTEDAKRRFQRSTRSMKDVEAYLKATSR